MYKRQLISTLLLLALCMSLLGAGFFSLYYHNQIEEIEQLLVQDVNYISSYAGLVLRDESGLLAEHFREYLTSVSLISNCSILLCDTQGNPLFMANLEPPPDYVTQAVPEWIVARSLEGQGFFGITSFEGLFQNPSYATGVPILQQNTFINESGQVVEQNVPVALLFVAQDASYVSDFLREAFQIFIITAACVLLIAVAICSISAQYAVQPLQLMASAAYRFARGELDTRLVDFSNRKDEIGELAKAFNVMAESLGQSEKRRSEFVANVSHELKTPMTTIAGFAEGMLDGTVPREKEKESLAIISSETRRLSRLIQRMLELSRLQSQERVAAQVQFDAGEVLLRVLLSLEGKIIDRNLEVVTELPDEGAMVWGEPDAVTQVCYNLLDNAIKFSKEGGTLTLRIVLKAGKAYISIRNEGITIPPEQLPHVFDRFHKVDSSRSEREGVGLGLYIVKTILNTYKESIDVTSEHGETEFTFTLSEV